MQRCYHGGQRGDVVPFSILGRIGGDATGDGVSVTVVVSALSVSSVGSEAMQQTNYQTMENPLETFSILGRIGGDATIQLRSLAYLALALFQYPRSDRRRCNHFFTILMIIFFILSVSSVGSEAMQRHSSQGYQMSGIAFSILGRIGGDATLWQQKTPRTDVRFQYPRSDRRRCNWPCRWPWGWPLSDFQYPRSDRRRCNTA